MPPLGADPLLFLRLEGREILGQRVGIELDLADGGVRHFDAFVTSFGQLDRQGEQVCYQLELRPRRLIDATKII